jgi:hypothetical protein
VRKDGDADVGRPERHQAERGGRAAGGVVNRAGGRRIGDFAAFPAPPRRGFAPRELDRKRMLARVVEGEGRACDVLFNIKIATVNFLLLLRLSLFNTTEGGDGRSQRRPPQGQGFRQCFGALVAVGNPLVATLFPGPRSPGPAAGFLFLRETALVRIL